MLSSDDYIIKRLTGIAIMFLLISTHPAKCQVSILDSVFTFRAGKVKTGNALNIISRATGYYFSFDSKLIDIERKRELSFRSTMLKVVLDSLLKNDSLQYSVINKYIIIYKASPVQLRTSEIPEWETKYITGTITDFETGDPLPFATIGIIRTGRGTVTNNNGEFGLQITRDCIHDSLTVSFLGYINRKIPVIMALNNKFNIALKREFISIPEIIIRSQAPQEILRRAYNAIPRNYGSTPASLTAFYREAITKKNLLQIYSEAILQVYKSAYSTGFPNDQIKIIKSRKLENVGMKDTLTIRLKAGLNSCLMLDGARNYFDFILPENYGQYDYRMTDIVTIDEESAFVIEFEQKQSVDIPLFKGSIYINTVNWAIMQAEFEINPDYIQKRKDDFISYQAKGYYMWPVSIKYYVNYRKVNNRYFLNHVRGDLRFNARQKTKLFSSSFDVFFELAVTDINLKNVTRFEREELAPIYSVFSKTITNYDPLFWGNQDFLKPEDNLLQALKNMKVRLQEFSK